MPTYLIHVTIENKPGISDPEGETILNDLVLKGQLFLNNKNPFWENIKISNR